MQSVLRRTVADYAAADQQPSGKQLELRLVQCQEEIRTPQILYFAKKYPWHDWLHFYPSYGDYSTILLLLLFATKVAYLIHWCQFFCLWETHSSSLFIWRLQHHTTLATICYQSGLFNSFVPNSFVYGKSCVNGAIYL